MAGLFENLGRTGVLREAAGNIRQAISDKKKDELLGQQAQLAQKQDIRADKQLIMQEAESKQRVAVDQAKLEEYNNKKKQLEAPVSLHNWDGMKENSPRVYEHLMSIAKPFVDNSNPENPVIKMGDAAYVAQASTQLWHADTLTKLAEQDALDAYGRAKMAVNEYRMSAGGKDLANDKKFAALNQQMQGSLTQLNKATGRKAEFNVHLMKIIPLFTPESVKAAWEAQDQSLLVPKKDAAEISMQLGKKDGEKGPKSPLGKLVLDARNEPDPKVKQVYLDQINQLSQARGELTEGQALEHIRGLVNQDKEQAAVWTKKFRSYVDSGMSRSNAINQVQQDIVKQPVSYEPGVNEDGAEASEAPEDFTSLWGEDAEE